MAVMPPQRDEPAPGLRGAREFDFTDADFEKVRKLIYDQAGISLSPIKRDMVYSRLVRRLRATGQPSFNAYLSYLQTSGPEEWEVFVNSLTTNLTSFFREAHHFEILADQMAKSRQKPFRIWCSAASTGEEPYSLAMTACETFDSLTPPVTIVASDIDTNVLNTAKQGVYPVERTQKMAAERLRRFFLKGTGANAGSVRVRPELQALITFTRINLLDSRYPVDGAFDALFCRNVMIYFDKPTQYTILSKFRPLLKLEGLLYAGHSESFLHAADLFRSLGRTVYERSDAPPGLHRRFSYS